MIEDFKKCLSPDYYEKFERRVIEDISWRGEVVGIEKKYHEDDPRFYDMLYHFENGLTGTLDAVRMGQYININKERVNAKVVFLWIENI